MSFHILVVDDEELFRLVTVGTLESAGYSTSEAGDGAEAIARVEADAPDLLLLDLNMPILDGWRVLDHLHGKGLPTRVVAMTGLGDRDVAEARVGGLAGALIKPFPIETLLRACEVVLLRPVIVAPRPPRREPRRTFVSAGSVAVLPDGRRENCRLLEISRSGFRIETEAGMGPGERVRISVDVPGRARALECDGQVRWRQDAVLGGELEPLGANGVALLRDLGVF